MSITPARQEVLAFGTPCQGSSSRFVVAEGAEIDDAHGGMDGMRVGVRRGTVDQDYLRACHPDAGIRADPGQDGIWLDMTAGRPDAVLVVTTIANDVFDAGGGKGFVMTGAVHDDPAIYGEGAGIAVPPKDEALLADLNGALAAITANGEFRRIDHRQSDFDVTGGLPE